MEESDVAGEDLTSVGNRSKSSSIENDEQEDAEMRNLRQLFRDDFKTFLLNNILFSVQFFKNYDRDVELLRSECLHETNLEGGEFKRFDADDLHAVILSNVTFQTKLPSSPAAEASTEELHPLRIYVAPLNVKVSFNRSETNVKPRISEVPNYRFTAENCEEDCKEESGFVNLIELKSPEEKRESYACKTILPLENALRWNENGAAQKKGLRTNSVVHKDDKFYYLKPAIRSIAFPLNAYKTLETAANTSLIPLHCFQEKERQIMLRQRRTGAARERNRRIHLISSAYKRHFVAVFMEGLRKQMNYVKVDFDHARFHYDRIILKKGREIHHVIPCLELKEWPNCAVDFRSDRLQPKRPGWEWPNKSMQDVIKEKGCNLIPLGYHEASNEGDDYTLEWKIEFPKAEKYLLLHMMHTHVRCYIFSLILYKTYLVKDVRSIHFGPTHMANLLFFVVQKDFTSWPEYSQGETFLRFLNILRKTLQKKSLKDFFVRKRNLYESTPQSVLHLVQAMLTRVLENPVPYILKAIGNLKYQESFYPQLDCIRLYKILTLNDLPSYLTPKDSGSDKTKKKKKRNAENGKTVSQEQDNSEPAKTECIDEHELYVDKGDDPSRRREVLKMFVKQFIEIGISSIEYNAIEQSMLYLRYAKQLTRLLSTVNAQRCEIEEYTAMIEKTLGKCRQFADRTTTNPISKEETKGELSEEADWMISHHLFKPPTDEITGESTSKFRNFSTIFENDESDDENFTLHKRECREDSTVKIRL